MIIASALPIIGTACCNSGMLQGKDLTAALSKAMELKKKLPEFQKFGPTALGNALGIKQPSASDLIQNGRIAKSKYFTLVEVFADVVGPDHWGLPFTKREHDLVLGFRELPSRAQDKLMESLQKAAEKSRAVEVDLPDSMQPSTGAAGAAAKHKEAA